MAFEERKSFSVWQGRRGLPLLRRDDRLAECTQSRNRKHEERPQRVSLAFSNVGIITFDLASLLQLIKALYGSKTKRVGEAQT